jgi:photosystem II stability/assembly factor-like uncharacterized protein
MKLYFSLLIYSVCVIQALAQVDAEKIYVSHDQGDSWKPIHTGLPEDVAINNWTMHRDAVVIATDAHGIFISDDKFKSWHAANFGLPQHVKIDALISFDNILLAGTSQNGIYMSYNDGDSWQTCNIGLKNMTVRCFYIFNNTLFAGTNDGIYYSYDKGRSWTASMRSVQINAFTALNKTLFVATRLGAYRSDDNGRNWTASGSNGAMASIGADGDNLVAILYQGQSFVSTDRGAVWLDTKSFFYQYTFRLTPSSTKLLISNWRRTLRLPYYQQLTGPQGLPNVPFNLLLDTPYGILTASSKRDGC